MYKLAEIGHNVTGFSAFVEDNTPENLHYVYMEEAYKTAYSEEGDHALDLMTMAQASLKEMTDLFYGFSDITCEGGLRTI